MASQTGSSQLPSSSFHRLPTISASQALKQSNDAGTRAISTGLPQLDTILLGPQERSRSSQRAGGLARGQVTEMYGPPGVGKTAFGIQAAASAIHAGHKVVWLDAATPLAFPRLEAVIAAAGDGTRSPKELMSMVHHFAVPTLAHLLALVLHPVPSFPPPGTGLIVVDAVSLLFENAYENDRPKGTKNDAKWLSGRRYAILGELMSNLVRMATRGNLAVLLTSQTSTRVRTGLGALLMPSISEREWEAGVSTQLVLFRDRPPRGTEDGPDAEKWRGLRYVGVMKVKGVSMAVDGRFETVVPFTILKTGLHELQAPESIKVPIISSPTRPPKRPYDEVPDSDPDAHPDELLSDDDWIWDDAEVVPEKLADAGADAGTDGGAGITTDASPSAPDTSPRNENAPP
ncbi:P-loop containing nucleoside triphosphate hydrolase protein [Trichodelitschia bisporula]|uniref:P-loop containing nucleoside triphosphate hydrolase protein n=1 Tax=Trichodelitschia bisporula TaxID=703511 RepID=A0A6G1I5Y6_9PEZI|nr:P-loop containing nucleoside triphosphate hydrolase protein [Trichodelitschia bisporula]